MSASSIKSVVEAVLLAAGKPLTVDQLLSVFGDGEKPERNQIREAIDALQDEYAGRCVELVQVASGWRVQVSQEMEPWVSRLTEEKPARYTRALLETLALVAYRQPITRGEIEDIRGVSVSTSIMKTLQEREWVRIVGHRDVPGHPAMYGTTRQFLDYFNLKGLDDLPTLMELRDIDSINAELDLALPGESLPLPGESLPLPGESLPLPDEQDEEMASEAADESGDAAVVVQVAVDTPDNNETIH